MVKKKKIPELRFPEFEGEWQENKLNDFIIEYKGGAPLSPKDFVKFSKYEVIPKKGITSGGELILDKEQPTYCTESFFNKYKNSVVDNSYLITTLRDLVPTGPSIGYIVKNKSNNNYILAQGVYGFKINNNELSESFLIQLSNTKPYRELMQTIMVGSTQVHIRNSTFFNIKILSPLIPEQKRITSFLINVDNKLSQLKEKKRLIEQYKKGVMQKIFSQEIRFKDENGKEFPKWEKNILGNLLIKNSTKNKNRECDLVQSVSNQHGFINQDKYFEDRVVASKDLSNYYIIKKGCFAYNPSRINVGSLAYKYDDNTSVVSPLYISFTANNKFIVDKYLLNWFKTTQFIKQMNNSFEGSVRNTLSYESLSRMEIDFPIIFEQTKITNFLSAIDEKINLVNEQIEKAELWKKGLLQKMFC